MEQFPGLPENDAEALNRILGDVYADPQKKGVQGAKETAIQMRDFYARNLDKVAPENLEAAKARLASANDRVRIFETYGDRIKDATGHLYEIDVPDEDIAKMLDWDAPLSEQPESVREALGKIGVGDAKTGGEAYQQIAMKEATDRNWPTEGAKKYATEALQNLGIPGIKYYDGGSRSAGEGTRNMVLFDELARRAKVLKRNDEVISEPSVDEFIGRLLNK